MKNYLIEKLIAISSRRKSKGNPDHFLIVSTTALGDTLWATPALRALRYTYPKAYIAVLTSSLGHEVLKDNPHVNELFVVGDPPLRSLFKLYPILKERAFGSIILFHTSQRPILPFCALLKPQRLIGSVGINKGLDALLTHPIQQKVQHEIARRLELVAQVGAVAHGQEMEIATKASNFLNRHGLESSDCLIGMHPGAKDLFKQWEPGHFIAAGKKFVEERGAKIIVSGSRSEQQLVEEIVSKVPGAVPMIGELDLASFAGLIGKMSLFITNDTGPMHLAFAVKTPTVALFGPTDAKLCGPYFVKNATVIQKAPTCTPCLRKRCREPFCLLQIGPNEVYQAGLGLLNENFSITGSER